MVNARPNAIVEFRDCLIERGLDDLGFPGNPFTSRRGEIKERLDQAVCTLERAHKFLRIAFINEEHVHFDHRPLVLDMDYFSDNMFSRPKGRVKQPGG